MFLRDMVLLSINLIDPTEHQSDHPTEYFGMRLYLISRVWGLESRFWGFEYGIGGLGLRVRLKAREVCGPSPRVRRLHGFFAHKKPPHPLGPQWEPRHGPTVGSYGVAVSYKRGTPVALPHSARPTMFKLTCWDYGYDPVNFGAKNSAGTPN